MTKEQLFSTARIRADLPHVPEGFEPDQIVSVRYFTHAYNPPHGVTEAVYVINNDAMLYARALTDFVL